MELGRAGCRRWEQRPELPYEQVWVPNHPACADDAAGGVFGAWGCPVLEALHLLNRRQLLVPLPADLVERAPRGREWLVLI